MDQFDLLKEQEQILELFEKIKSLTNGRVWEYSKLQEIHGDRITIHLTIRKFDKKK